MIAGGLARTGADRRHTALGFPVGKEAGTAFIKMSQEHGALRLGWLVDSNLTLLSLSVQFGLFFGTLRLCTRAGCGRVFLADEGRRRCDACFYTRLDKLPPKLRRVWPFRKDSLRHRPDGRELVRQAEDDLYALSPEKWLRKWDKPEPLGRGRPRKRT